MPPASSAAETVGEVPCKWQKHEASYAFRRGATVGDLKHWLAALTDVPPPRQKLMGWAKPADGTAIDDATPLASIKLSSRRLMVMGTPQAEHVAIEQDLERGKRTQRFITNDLKPPPPPLDPAQWAPPVRRSPPSAVHANRGGGIYLDPAVWGPPVQEERRSQRSAAPTHVLNPHTNRLEQLALANALLNDNPAGAGAGPRLDGPVPRPEEQPINMDLTGQVRGRCTACTRCAGYTRREELAANENDLDALRCARCGCQSHEHEAV